MIAVRFGTTRGLVRLALAYLQLGLGRAYVTSFDRHAITRLVFVCHGNICRSAFADVAARGQGLACASFGLSTSADQPAYPTATEAARAFGQDLAAHRTTRVEDFVLQPGDLLLAMEVRQLRRLSTMPGMADVPRSLLGLWARPPIPHLHDPYQLDDRYMRTCFRRIESAVAGLAKAFPNARTSR